MQLEEPRFILFEEGATKLVYRGTLKGKWKGPCTEFSYPVTPGKAIFADNRDRERLLEQRGANGVPMFEVAHA